MFRSVPSSRRARLSTLRTLIRAHFTSGSLVRRTAWRNESPPGGLTELYVYTPETIWPDSSLGVFAVQDPRFRFPGHVGLAQSLESQPPSSTSAAATEASSVADTGRRTSLTAKQPDVLTRPTNLETQAQTLYHAHDFIQHTTDSERYVCSDVLSEFPELPGMKQLDLRLHEAPMLLKKELQLLFPGKDMVSGHLSVITMSRRTHNDMSAWSDAMEDEREELTEHFVSAAKEICGKLKDEGCWADFIDPSSGRPYFSGHTNTTMFETDEKYRLLGFRIEDLGCCKVICHADFGRHVFIGTIITNSHSSTGVVDDLLTELKLTVSKK